MSCCSRSDGPSWSRAIIATTAAMQPPALAPLIASLVGSISSTSGVCLDPTEDVVAVLDRGRERIFGGETVVDREHRAARLETRLAAVAILGLEISDDESPTVEMDHSR